MADLELLAKALEAERAVTEYFKAEAIDLRERLAAFATHPERVWSVRRGRWLMAYVTPVARECLCPSHASNRGECVVHDDKGRVRLGVGQA